MNSTTTTPTLEYYNKNAAAFTSSTQTLEFCETQDSFLKYLSPQASILDFGCGAGRDTKYFLEKGYQVTAIDGSEELCRMASEYTGIPVKQMLFQDLDCHSCYDGIWACSSILHLSSEDLKAVFIKMAAALKPDGIVYASFKYGSYEGMRNGRYFIDMNEQRTDELMNELNVYTICRMWITSDIRPGRGEEKWLNLILQKK
ncbi:MAG: class I SAM-dependent methyltransferase [Lachnospiraceae bacterium]|nr:class I SAM-dependent methyltransferase [Lachnospiraceae bacterium]